MLQIEWKSALYHSDGRPRSRPKASTMHGWLVKWRATFSGNERLRKEGIREMREAKAVREWKRKREAARRAKAGASRPLCCLGAISLGKARRAQSPKTLSRAPPIKRPNRQNTWPVTSPAHSPRSTPANSRRASYSHQAGDRTPRNSRKTSYNSQRSVIRAAERTR